uniref:3-isopropylmalate dehydratase large subunit n=1 Tax=uncultured marine thaumarchaeote KM3_06_C02 TaxID=1455976 RepID=A0A075G5J4_9ARCH|nr:putative 3-isopropylmalate dehydratase (leuC) [uncultured marine thaumarchaeote KM3_06_C02]
MGKTLSEKIIGEHAGKEVSANETVITNIDYCFSHDASGPMVISRIKELGGKVFNPSKTIFFVDHAVPSPRLETSNEQKKLKIFAQDTGSNFSQAGGGICHQVMVEDYINPGELVIGADSHSVMGGALGAFSTGMGATDVAVSMVLGKTWLRVPESIKIIINGMVPSGVYSKDIILTLINMLGSDGADYNAIEFHGSCIDNMEIHERFTLSNMVIESGAKAGLISSDRVTRDYLEKRGRVEKYRSIQADEDAEYVRTIELDGSNLSPVIAMPHSVDNVKPIEEVQGEQIDTVFIGSCTNSRLEDLHVVASILKDREIKTRLIVTPASHKIYQDAVRDGTVDILLQTGAVVTPSGCGMCFGALGGIPADGEKVLATTNRNFKGRTGNPKAFTYLSSPATAAATAVEGMITDPRKYL